MNILKPGKFVDDVKFTCIVCGCEFEANKTEYYVDHIIIKDGWHAVVRCGCPTCSVMCSNIIEKE